LRRRHRARDSLSASSALIAAVLTAAPTIGQAPLLTPGGCSDAGPDGGATVAASSLVGAIASSNTGALVPGALVTVSAADGRRGDRPPRDEMRILADPRGVFRLCALPMSGRTTLQAHYAGYAGVPVTISVGEGSVIRQDLSVPVAGTRANQGLTDGQASGQGEALGRVVARIRDAHSREPVDAAFLLLERKDWQALTDRRGQFALSTVRAGLHVIRIYHIAYGTVLWSIEVPPGQTLDVQVELMPEPIELEPLVVTAVRSRRLEHKGFYDRRSWGERVGVGHFLTSGDIERSNPYRVTSLMGIMPGVHVECRGGTSCYVRMAGSRCATSSLYLDGIEFNTLGEPIDHFVLPSDVAGIEVYRGMGEMAAEFADPVSIHCGAVVIWTKSGA